MRLHIGIDLMGGDNPPDLLFPAILEAAKKLPYEPFFHVIATELAVHSLASILSLYPEISKRIFFEICADVIEMADDPLSAMRLKKNSSIALGIRLLKEKRIDAFVSCGNTGALIASAAVMLPQLPGTVHPALLVTLPTKTGLVAVLDAGGNILNRAEDLVSFAFLGAAYQHVVQNIEIPRVGLLNVGVEARKGTMEIRQAHDTLNSYGQNALARGLTPSLDFYGNVEGCDLFNGCVDVLVTDGFSGNVLLKTAEGVSSFILESLKNKIENLGFAFEGVFNDLKQQFNYTEYPGAIVCGVEGLVVKVHGNATAGALLASILNVAEWIEKQVIARISRRLNDNSSSS